jgi:hypothetical protein
MCGDFFPPEYKSFPFTKGDLLSSRNAEGKYMVSKVLKIDRITLKKGDRINIQEQKFVASEDDFLLIISCAYGGFAFNSLDEAKAAAKAGTWKVGGVEHIPNRAPGAAEGQSLIGHQAVTESELRGYNEWKTAFSKGEAGVF